MPADAEDDVDDRAAAWLARRRSRNFAGAGFALVGFGVVSLVGALLGYKPAVAGIGIAGMGVLLLGFWWGEHREWKSRR